MYAIEKIADHYVVTFRTEKGTKTSVNAFKGYSPVSMIHMNYRNEIRTESFRKRGKIVPLFNLGIV